MEFAEDYFESEVRSGFYVPGIMKRCWAAQLEVLSDINRVCVKHNLKWCLAYGSMIGAARHKGFIPWDDDLDIYMRRDDFEVFKSVYREEMPEGNCLLGPETRNYENWIWRIVDRLGVGSSDAFMKKYHGFPYSAGVDIFVLDFVNSDKIANGKRDNAAVCNLVLMHFLLNAWSRTKPPRGCKPERITLQDLAKIKKKNAWRKELDVILKKHRIYCDERFNREESILDQSLRLHDKLCKEFTEEGADQVAVLGWWLTKRNDIYPVDYMDHLLTIDFEGMEGYMPETYDKDLRTIFGDWTQFVRASGHGYPYFLSSENMVLEKTKGKMKNPYFYEFDPTDMETDRESRDGTNKDSVSRMLRIMRDLLHGLENAEKFEKELQLGILEKLQHSVIVTGELIEEKYTVSGKVITKLEKYCEEIYILYRKINESSQNGEVCTEAEEQALFDEFEVISALIEKEILEKKEVIFVPLQYKHWDNLKEEFSRLKQDPRYDVYIMPLPYFRKDGMMEKVSDTVTEKEEFKKEGVMVLDASWEELRKRHPDIIIMDSAADQYDSTLNVEPQFYSKQLVNITEKLIYIPWIKTDEFTTDQGLMMRSAKFYLTTPGVIRADYSFVQSEAMADTYRKVLTEFAGADTEKVWEKKIQAYERITEYI